jgi:hypothetical protein
VTIRRGEPWGTPVVRPPDLRVVISDAEVAAAARDDPNRPVTMSGGDLHRSLGSPTVRSEMQRLPIDVLEITADSEVFTAVAHVVLRRSWWRGRIVAAMNVDHVGGWNVAPRAHPNDGRVDLIDVDATMTLRERWQARVRLATGTHLPHPKITVRTATTAAWTFDRPHGVWIDGVRLTDARSVSVVVRPDAFAVLV